MSERLVEGGLEISNMATLTSFPEEECLNVYWKIKNFSFCCEDIESPQFSFFGNQYCLMFCPGSVDVECSLQGYAINQVNLTREISLLTCDGSSVESISGGQYVSLRVPNDVIFGKRRNSFLPEDTITVVFRFPTKSERGKVFICSQIGVKRKYFLWNVKSFSNRQLTAEISVEKSKRYGDIKLTLKSEGGVNTDEQFYIEISRTGGGSCYYTLKVSVLDVDGKAVNDTSDEFIFEKKEGQFIKVFPAFFKKSEFLACKNMLLLDDTLSLKCSFAISLGTLEDPTDEISYCEPFIKESDHFSILRSFKEKNDSVSELQIDLKNSLEEGILFDVSLHIGSEIIRAHKHILSARSPVFKTMFTKDMKGTIDNVVVIEDFDVETIRSLVLYMYTDSIHEYQWESVKKLYFVAVKYEVMSLKKKCVSFLKANLSVSNVCEGLFLSDLHQDANLKIAAIDFISECDMVVFASEAWKELEKSNSHLAIDVLREICHRRQFKSI